MKKFIFTGLGMMMLAALAIADYPRQITRPKVPTNAELARLGLKRHWHTYVPVQGARDGIVSLQIFEKQIAVQTRMGSIASVDLESGATQWSVLPGHPYRAFQLPVGANENNFLVYASGKLLGLDRKTGMTEWSLDLPGIPATVAAADEEHLYIGTSDGMVRGYFLPFSLRQSLAQVSRSEFEEALRRRGLSSERINSRVPEMIWSYQLPAAIRVAPAVFGTHVVFADGEGSIYCIENERRTLGDHFRAGASVAADLAQTSDFVYLASLDRQVYAAEQVAGKLELRWRHTAGSQMVQKPFPIGSDLFVVSSVEGMTRLERHTGLLYWTQPRAKRFLAASQRLVVAVDEFKNLLILDRARGSVLAAWNVKDFTVLSANEFTDRIVLASHDGFILCLRDVDRNCDNPMNHLPKVEKKPSSTSNGGATEGKDKSKDMEKKVDDDNSSF